MKNKCAQCKQEFETEDQHQLICSEECKQQALAELDRESDECLSCQ